MGKKQENPQMPPADVPPSTPPADAPPPAVTSPAADPAPATIKARVLMQCSHGAPDDVVEVSAEVAKADPALDAHPDAVAYAESLKAAGPEQA